VKGGTAVRETGLQLCSLPLCVLLNVKSSMDLCPNQEALAGGGGGKAKETLKGNGLRGIIQAFYDYAWGKKIERGETQWESLSHKPASKAAPRKGNLYA